MPLYGVSTHSESESRGTKDPSAARRARSGQVKVGDKVMAMHPKDGTTGPQVVTQLHVNEGLKSQGSVTSTRDHPFFVRRGQSWVEAGDLEQGDELISSLGKASIIVTSVRPSQAVARVSNLTVSNTHSYYVLAGHVPVLVHNNDCLVGKLSDKLPDGNEQQTGGGL
ncbi:polymorphic toxin-type HINT domain-containing protein [Kribbella sp. NPDC051620]|uniref:polymorphic toxin-type HINT domain-containing protein n=1 Tax=Kribbella sp. NPDC051620 TaxID=3364120 RepID=UPI00379A9C58